MSRLDNIRRRFDQKKILLMDGASGTLRCDHPHRLYISAGADIVTTDTFNRHTAELCPSRDVFAYNHAKALDIADDTTVNRKQVLIAGSIAPHYSDSNQPSPQALALIQGGCDLLLLETIYDISMPESCLRSINKAIQISGSDLPLMVSATVNSRGALPSGESVERFVEVMQKYGVFSIGLNCSEGVDSMIASMRRIAALTDCHRSFCPSAGLPDPLGKYPDSDDYIIDRMSEVIEDGLADIIGGCCGTTPTLISRLRNLIDNHLSKASR